MCCPLLAQTPLPAPLQAPEPVKTSITVVENIATETPADITVLDTGSLDRIPGVNLDDRLRQVPGFSLFRRTSSLVAHPTTQGISLRGIGSSGASRTLLLWDGIPANDPFGGWVYWTQFIPEEMERVEISRGAATSVFGDRAMSGAIALFTAPAESRRLIASFEAGNRDTEDATLGYSVFTRVLAISGAARAFTTDGYYIVPQPIRGSVDRKANVRFATGDVHVDRADAHGGLFFRLNLLAEERRNGTVLTGNSTGLGTVAVRWAREFGENEISVAAYHTREGFHSSFSSVSADRATERLTYTQSVPSDATGGAALWQRQSTRWHLTAGADANRAGGTSTDFVRPSGLRVGGGVQWQHGIFGQADASLGPARFYAGLRHSFAGQGNTFLSPSGGVTVGRHSLRARASVYRAFRAPTLNELFREFRVGNTDTLANPNLRPETLTGVEAGADWILEGSSVRVTAYRNTLDSLITNVTLSSVPNAIVRQRQNAASALSRGIEAEWRGRRGNWSGQLSYLLADSRYVTGFRVAQVPRHQGSGEAAYQRGGTLISLGLRSYSYQFDDDLNQFRLPGFATVQFVAAQRLAASLRAEVEIENALDRTYYTAFTPTPNTGAPRLWRIGLKWNGKL